MFYNGIKHDVNIRNWWKQKATSAFKWFYCFEDFKDATCRWSISSCFLSYQLPLFIFPWNCSLILNDGQDNEQPAPNSVFMTELNQVLPSTNIQKWSQYNIKAPDCCHSLLVRNYFPVNLTNLTVTRYGAVYRNHGITNR